MDYNCMGYRFRPTEEEIITYFLDRKISGLDFPLHAITTLNICEFEPWQLPAKSVLPDDEEWYFFSELVKKYPNSNRAERTTRVGYWKVTGSDRQILNSRGREIGVKKNLVFHKGRGSKAPSTSWVIHEYHYTNTSANQKPYILSRLRGNLDDKPESYSRGESNGRA